MPHEVAKGAARIATRIAGQIAVSTVLGITTLAPMAANAQTTQATPSTVAGPSKEVCHVAMQAFEEYVTHHLTKFSRDDKQQLALLNKWIGAGCQGTLRLKALPEVTVTTGWIQTVVGKKYDFNKVIKLVP